MINKLSIYLASASPRRRELLQQINVKYEVLLLRTEQGRNGVDETPVQGESPEAYVQRIAQNKAEAGWKAVLGRHLPKRVVLAADTTVSLKGEILGKPDNREHAEAMLKKLSGKTHQVLTCVAVALEEGVEILLSASTVTFAVLSESEIKHYVMTGEPLDKAGGYAIQGLAAAFVTHVEGSYSGVMGLPLYETVQLLKKFGGNVLS